MVSQLRSHEDVCLATLIVAAMLTLTAPLIADELPTAKPEDVGMSSNNLARVVPAMQQQVDDRKVAGAIAIVARRGKVVLFEAVGAQDIAANKPMATDTLVRIYSMSKPITSAAIMVLVESGQISLDDPVAKHLPELANVQVFVRNDDDKPRAEPPRRAMTVRDLLRHTAGLTYGFFGDTDVDRQYLAVNVLDRNGSLSDMSRKLGELPLLHHPGARFNYSVATDVLGALIEAVSDESLDEFFADRIFGPLDMRDTAFWVPDEKLERFASTYIDGEDGLRVVDAASDSRFRRKPQLLSGGGGLVSTARDYMRFCQMLLNRGTLDGARVLREKTVADMIQNQLPAEAYPISLDGQRPGVGFGLGFFSSRRKNGLYRRAQDRGVRLGRRCEHAFLDFAAGRSGCRRANTKAAVFVGDGKGRETAGV